MNSTINNNISETIEFPLDDLDAVLKYLYEEQENFSCLLHDDNSELDDEQLAILARSRNDHIYCNMARLQYWLDNKNS